MDYFAELDRLEQTIQDIKNELQCLCSYANELALKDEQTLAMLNAKNGIVTFEKRLEEEYGIEEPGKRDFLLATQMLRREIHTLNSRLKRALDFSFEIIQTILKASSLTAAEAIALLEHFNAYYKLEKIGMKTYIVPLDFSFIKTGSKSVAYESEIDEIAGSYTNIDGNTAKKSAYTAPIYKKTKRPFEDEIELNDKILIPVAGLEVGQSSGIQIYRRSGNNVELNGEILNLFPYDMIALLDFHIKRKLDCPEVTLESSIKKFEAENELTLSKDDPTLEDYYERSARKKV